MSRIEKIQNYFSELPVHTGIFEIISTYNLNECPRYFVIIHRLKTNEKGGKDVINLLVLDGIDDNTKETKHSEQNPKILQ